MKYILTILLLHITIILSGQIFADFEIFNVQEESFMNGSNGSGGFSENNIFIHNEYDPSYGGFWSGWSISNTTDTIGRGAINQYSAITGSGWNNSQTYAVSYAPIESRIILQNELEGSKMEGFYITNGTYPYYSMLDGDMFAKKFGGATGNDPDYFKLTIKKYLDGQLSTDSVGFFLADYRFDNNEEDYIVKDWEYIDLSSLGEVDSLSLTLSSTDTGIFGMNTPAYFCIDRIQVSNNSTSIDENLDSIEFNIFPNPSNGRIWFTLKFDEDFQIQVMDMNGTIVHSKNINSKNGSIDLSSLPEAPYLLRLLSKKYSHTEYIILTE